MIPARVLQLLENRNALAAAFILAMLLRLIAVIFFPVAPESDFAWYLVRAQEIASGLGYQEGGVPTAFWPIGYPAILAALVSLAGPGVTAGIMGNLIFAAITFWLIAGLGRVLGMTKAAVAGAALLWAIYPNSIFYTTQLTSEGPYIPFLMGAIWLLLVPRWQAALAAGLLFGVASLIKAQTYLFPAGLLILIWLALPTQRTRQLIARAVLVHLAMFAVILPWSARNNHALHSFVLISTNGGITLLNGNNDLATGGYVNEHDTPAIMKLYDRTGIPKEQRIARQVEFDALTKAMGWQWIKDHPVAFLKLMPRKLIGLWLVDGDAAWSYEDQYPAREPAIKAVRIANEIFYAAILLGAAIFAFLMARKVWLSRPLGSEAVPGAILFAFPIFITLISLLFSGQSRFHAPAMPFLIMAAAWVALTSRKQGLRTI